MRPGSRMKLTRGIDFILIFFLLVLGLSISLYYGRIGFMALDQSIIFDGAWRVLSGQIPFRDFHPPNGITPILLQVPFFACFGVNWFSYCLHAAVLNALFCLLVYWLLRLLGGPALLCFFYALLSSVVMYPPMGVPYMDQHAFFFTMLALVFSVAALKTKISKLQILFWFGVSFAFVLGYLSKQVPTLFAIPLILFMILTKGRQRIKSFVILVSGLIVLLLLLWISAESVGIDWKQIQYYAYELPSQIGGERLSRFINQGILFSEILRIKKEIGSFYAFYLSQGAVLGLGLFLFIIWMGQVKNERRDIWKKLFLSYLFELGLIEGLFLISFLFVLLTQNQLANGVPFIFAGVGITHIIFERHKRSNSTSPISGWNKIIHEMVLTLIGIMFMMACLRDATIFHEKINETRNVHEIVYLKEKSLNRDQLSLPKALDFLVWETPYPHKAENILELVTFFENNPGNFFLLGDTSILYGITKRPSIAPSLWFHPGLAIPPLNTREFEAYENHLIQNMKKHNVKYIVLEGRGTWEGVRLSHFSKLSEIVKNSTHQQISIGPFQIIELSLNDESPYTDVKNRSAL